MKNILFFAVLINLNLAATSFIAKGQTATLDGIALNLAKSGIRQKTIFRINVYRASLFTATKPTAELSLDTLLAMPAFALRLDFMRDVKSEELVKGFEDALKANNVPESLAIAQFKNTLKSRPEIKKGQKITIAVNRTLNMFICEQENQTPIILKGDDSLFRHIFSMWFGIPADSGLAALKKSLTAPAKN
jgi:hypothetical protein